MMDDVSAQEREFLPTSIGHTIFDFLGNETGVTIKVYFGEVVSESLQKYGKVTGSGGGASIGYRLGNTYVTAQKSIKIETQEVEDRRLYVRLDGIGKEFIWKFGQDAFPARKGSRVAVVVLFIEAKNTAHEMAYYNLDTGDRIVLPSDGVFKDYRKFPGISSGDKKRTARIMQMKTREKLYQVNKAFQQGQMLEGDDYPEVVTAYSISQVVKEPSPVPSLALLGFLGGALYFFSEYFGGRFDLLTAEIFAKMLYDFEADISLKFYFLGPSIFILIGFMTFGIFLEKYRLKRVRDYVEKYKRLSRSSAKKEITSSP